MVCPCAQVYISVMHEGADFGQGQCKTGFTVDSDAGAPAVSSSRELWVSVAPGLVQNILTDFLPSEHDSWVFFQALAQG